MKFPTKYSEHVRVNSNSGDRMRVEYHLEIDDDGIETLKSTGMHDLYAEIQTHADSVDLNLILARFMNGDETAIERVNGFYADVSDMPVKLQDMLNINIRGKEIFESLPKEYRDLYGNNYIKFINEPEILAAKLSEVDKRSDIDASADREHTGSAGNGSVVPDSADSGSLGSD